MKTSAVDLIVHGPPGSAPPVLAEALIAAHRELNGDAPPWVPVPRGDDPGVDAMNTLVTRPGDANVLSTCTPVFLQAPLLRGGGRTHRQMTPLARLVSDRYLVVARTDSPWRTPADFLHHVTRGASRTGGYFRGGINHLLALAVAEAVSAKIEFVVVPDEPEVWRRIIAGSLDWGSGVAAEVLPHIEAGELRPIAALAESRLPNFPDIPTLAEVGAPVSFSLWRGLMGPPGLSEEAQAGWHATIAALRKTDAWRTYLKRNGQTDDFLPGEAFRRFLDSEWDWFKKHYALAGLLPSGAPTA